uniref:Uncharacterized protein n=1 Tax=Mus spicilegus TaxID=10103 RepID=A0A8C6IK10_MUSSI
MLVRLVSSYLSSQHREAAAEGSWTQEQLSYVTVSTGMKIFQRDACLSAPQTPETVGPAPQNGISQDSPAGRRRGLKLVPAMHSQAVMLNVRTSTNFSLAKSFQVVRAM